MEPFSIATGVASLVAWIYLTFFHVRFWRADQRLDEAAQCGCPAAPASGWPEVAEVVPARDEADVIADSLASLIDQDYPGSFRVVLIDDRSSDGTGDAARSLAERHLRGDRLAVVEAGPLPSGWAGKMWAVHSGVEAASRSVPQASYRLLTDADVVHSPGNLRRLVATSEAEGLDLVSLMVLLHCRRGWERLLIPAFIYFFQKLYPFPRVNDPRSPTAGAAGGCLMVRAEALERAGGARRSAARSSTTAPSAR